MPIASTQAYLKSLLDGMPMPGGPATPNLVAYITPPDPNVDSQFPTLYIWPSDGDENRAGTRGGTLPRKADPTADSGTKSQEHVMDLYLVYMMDQDDPDGEALFPGMVDAIMAVLRVSPDPVVVTDPWNGFQSQLIDVGETMSYRITLLSLTDERYDRYDALITVRINEIFFA